MMLCFGLEAVVRDIRLANLNASDVVINDSVLMVVLCLMRKIILQKETDTG